MYSLAWIIAVCVVCMHCEVACELCVCLASCMNHLKQRNQEKHPDQQAPTVAKTRPDTGRLGDLFATIQTDGSHSRTNQETPRDSQSERSAQPKPASAQPISGSTQSVLNQAYNSQASAHKQVHKLHAQSRRAMREAPLTREDRSRSRPVETVAISDSKSTQA